MPLDVHLFGEFRKLVPGSKASEDTILTVAWEEGMDLAKLVTKLEIPPDATGDCFVNGKLARGNTPIPDGARVGLFPSNMVLLCGGQHLKGHGLTKDHLDIDYY